ncbi:hypothetical protein MHA01_14750 [Marinococcus halophilus]|uniref:Uncharacterized protein n=1 Tax=Marinococcus halophilus TaxID=1371 RepID=A0A510Y5E3_MARHA|nr:hypothetical protein MHA01_14750 [Marinococcus halophilus]
MEITKHLKRLMGEYEIPGRFQIRQGRTVGALIHDLTSSYSKRTLVKLYYYPFYRIPKEIVKKNKKTEKRLVPFL